jgi:hypothetical protein
MTNNCNVASVYASTQTTSGGLTAEQLARNWHIPIDKARQTIEVTTQRGIRTRPFELMRRFKTNDRLLRYNRLTTTMFTDTMKSVKKSRRGNKWAQVFTIPPAWVKVYAMKNKSDAHLALDDLLRDVGAPEVMVMDGSLEQMKSKFRDKCRDAGVKMKQTEPHSPWSN